MKRFNLAGMIALAMIWCCGTGAFAALIGTETVRSETADVVSIGVIRGWVTESGTDLQTNEVTPAPNCQPNFTELLAWYKNVDLFSDSNAMVLACRYSLESKTTVFNNLPAKESNQIRLSRTTFKAIPSGLFVCGIAGWAVLRLRRTGHIFS